MAIAASTAARGASKTAKNSSARASTSWPPSSATAVRSTVHTSSISAAEALAELVHQPGRALHVGHQHRHEPGRQARPGWPGRAGADCSSLVMNPTGTMRKRLAACSSRVRARSRGGVVLEGDLAEAGEGVADVGGVVDRQAARPLRVDVGEGAIRGAWRARGPRGSPCRDGNNRVSR